MFHSVEIVSPVLLAASEAMVVERASMEVAEAQSKSAVLLKEEAEEEEVVAESPQSQWMASATHSMHTAECSQQQASLAIPLRLLGYADRSDRLLAGSIILKKF